jgi:DNA-binding CsgD family transcriptional regulator
VVPFVAGQVVVSDAADDRHFEFLNDGYDDGTAERLAGEEFRAEVEELGMMRGPAALRMRDVPAGPESVEAITSCLYPAGFVEGITVTLYGIGGRYVGLLNMSTVDAEHPSDDARDLLQMLSVAIGHTVDPIVRLGRDDVMDGYDSIALVTDDHETRSVGQMPLGPLATDQLALIAATRVGNGRGQWLAQVDDDWYRIRAYRTAHGAASGVVVTASNGADLLGLTRRELEVLTLVSGGLSNPDIAERLGVSRRTVATHIESILSKLGLPNRAAAVGVALRHGLELLR